MTVQEVLTGDCRDVLRKREAGSMNTCVTSPPYWGLRDYGVPPSIWGGDPKCEHEFDKRGFCECNAWRGCYGLEPTYQLYIEHTVEIFEEVWRVLRPDGTLWLNLGDCYATRPCGWSAQKYWDEDRDNRTFRDKPFSTIGGGFLADGGARTLSRRGRSGNLGNGGKNGIAVPAGRVVGTRKARGKFKSGDRQTRVEGGVRAFAGGGLKPKDLAGMPWRVALALQDAGWWLRRDIIWHKQNPMPESVYDRPTTAHEYLFQFSKSASTLCWRHRDGRWVWKKPPPDLIWRHRETRFETRTPQTGPNWFKINLWRGFDYYYDFEAIMEPSSPNSHARAARSRSATHKHADGRRAKAVGPNSRIKVDRVPVSRKLAQHDNPQGPRVKANESFDLAICTGDLVPMRNKRSVWSIATQPFKEAHFATFPEKLVEPCILAGCPKGGVVLDPFGGAGTVGVVAQRLGRGAVLIEINKKYAAMAKARIARARMGPEEKKRHTTKASGKLKPVKGLPLFTKRKAVTRDSAQELT